jgi:TetR/AcrR family transcriptional regulator, repressor of fatR-cypB operon
MSINNACDLRYLHAAVRQGISKYMKDDAQSVDLAKLLKEKDFSAHSPRERILAAALKLFVDQGYFNTNVPDLSRESKCSVGSIYHNFKNKEEVGASLYQEGISAFRQALDQSIGDEEDLEILIKTVVKSFLQFSEVNHQLSKYMWLCRHNEFMSGSIKHPTMVGFDRLGRKLTRAIKNGIRAKKIRPLRANIIWSILFGMPQGYVRDWLDGRSNTPPPSEVADELADACWRALT